MDTTKRIMPVREAPPSIQRLAECAEAVVEYTNPNGEKVYRFIVDGRETMCPPTTKARDSVDLAALNAEQARFDREKAGQ